MKITLDITSEDIVALDRVISLADALVELPEYVGSNQGDRDAVETCEALLGQIIEAAPKRELTVDFARMVTHIVASLSASQAALSGEQGLPHEE